MDEIYNTVKKHYDKYAETIYNYMNKQQNTQHQSIFDVKNKTVKFNLNSFKKIEIKDQLLLAEMAMWNEAIFTDVSMQESWVKIIKPDYTLLKFRFPFGYDMKYKHLDGDIYYPIYGPKYTTETRLLIIKDKHKFKSKEWDTLKYEQNMAYFNWITRKQYYQHKYDNISNIDHCYDCTAHIHIWSKYFDKYSKFISGYNNTQKSKDEFIEKSIKQLIYDLTIEQYGKYKSIMDVYIGKGKKNFTFSKFYSNPNNIKKKIQELKDFIIQHKLNNSDNNKVALLSPHISNTQLIKNTQSKSKSIDKYNSALKSHDKSIRK